MMKYYFNLYQIVFIERARMSLSSGPQPDLREQDQWVRTNMNYINFPFLPFPNFHQDPQRSQGQHQLFLHQ